MGYRNPVRLLAPICLVAALVGVIVVVQASQPESSESARTPSETTARQRRAPARRARARRFYVVRAGDNLTVIADRTGVAVDDIESYNPDLDAQALRVGQRLRLTP